jgi:chromate transporter
MENKVGIKAITQLFLKLGFIGFGGPAAHIAMMQREVVVHKKWMDEQEFLDLVGATNLIPGPNSTEMAIHIGYKKGGWKGLFAAGLSFILPAVFITGVFAWLYRLYGQLPEVQPFLYGIKPAIISIIIGAVYPLAQKSSKSAFLVVVGIGVLVLALLGIHEIYLMFGAGLLAAALHYIRNTKKNTLQGGVPLYFLQMGQAGFWSATDCSLFWIFLKIGSILYGSGYVLFAFLDTELVATGLLTRQQLTDAITVGQFTPGPVFSSVTFIGYQINGLSGAIISTCAIFLPSFVFVALLNPFIKMLRRSELLSAFLDAVNVASVALIAAVCFSIGQEAITEWRTVTIALLSVVTVFKFRKLNTAFIVLGGSLLGYLLFQV